MANVSKQTIFEASIDAVFATIIDYARYPEFVDGVDEIKVLEVSDKGARVKYSINLMKKFEYVLKLKHQTPTHVSWELESGDIFKENSGSWTLKDLGNGKTQVQYDLSVDVKMFVPKMIATKLVEGNLPRMLKAYEAQAQKR